MDIILWTSEINKAITRIEQLYNDEMNSLEIQVIVTDKYASWFKQRKQKEGGDKTTDLQYIKSLKHRSGLIQRRLDLIESFIKFLKVAIGISGGCNE